MYKYILNKTIKKVFYLFLFITSSFSSWKKKKDRNKNIFYFFIQSLDRKEIYKDYKDIFLIQIETIFIKYNIHCVNKIAEKKQSFKFIELNKNLRFTQFSNKIRLKIRLKKAKINNFLTEIEFTVSNRY
ncbi:hypothetical protein BpHYR1_013869 [Brachionus plicatilis]|uniref:Uncharacterized protein n=1 Tax=Brachionus plicatilis TaxID=10195 RepID=A0A3M7SA94_BRAPC|nr:hypothetical protein BpHYR1_013869 [Brachionus plicatilis]